MNELIDNIFTFETENFTVKVDALVDYDVDLSWDESGETREKLETGEYTCFCAKAYVLDNQRNELSSDYLGACIYSDIADFKDNHKTKKGEYGSYFKDMINIVINDARTEYNRERVFLKESRQ